MQEYNWEGKCKHTHRQTFTEQPNKKLNRGSRYTLTSVKRKEYWNVWRNVDLYFNITDLHIFFPIFDCTRWEFWLLSRSTAPRKGVHCPGLGTPTLPSHHELELESERSEEEGQWRQQPGDVCRKTRAPGMLVYLLALRERQDGARKVVHSGHSSMRLCRVEANGSNTANV